MSGSWLDAGMNNTKTTTTTRRLIVVTTHDDVYEDGECIESGYTEEVDAGPATLEQIEASDAAGDTGFFFIDEDGDVIGNGEWHASQGRTAYVTL